MKPLFSRAFTTSWAFAILAGTVLGQTAPVPPATAPAARPAATEETIQLTVFEVLADRDDSYGALNSNSVTRFNTELAKLPISADIYNEAFMRDVNASSVEAMLRT